MEIFGPLECPMLEGGIVCLFHIPCDIPSVVCVWWVVFTILFSTIGLYMITVFCVTSLTLTRWFCGFHLISRKLTSSRTDNAFLKRVQKAQSLQIMQFADFFSQKIIKSCRFSKNLVHISTSSDNTGPNPFFTENTANLHGISRLKKMMNAPIHGVRVWVQFQYKIHETSCSQLYQIQILCEKVHPPPLFRLQPAYWQ